MTIHALPLLRRLARNHPAPVAAASIGRHNNVAPVTGPFDALRDVKRALVVADVENWVYSARDLGFAIDFQTLARLLKRQLPRSLELHGVLSVEPGQIEATRDQGAAAGWLAHPRSIITSSAHRHANADVTFAFAVASALAKRRADAVVLGTGDGALGLDIARSLRRDFPDCRTIVTLSLAGATSRLLDARRASEIDANIEIGMDVLRPLI